MIKITTHYASTFADRVTPVGLYLNLRDLFPQSILLESSEVDDQNYAHSILCADPIAGFQLKGNMVNTFFGERKERTPLGKGQKIQHLLEHFVSSFERDAANDGINGLFGFQCFEAVKYFETDKAALCPNLREDIPILDYRLYRFVISFNHFNGELKFLENTIDNSESRLKDLIPQLMEKQSGTYAFEPTGEETCGDKDSAFIEKVKKAKQHCQLGDVFQMVISRQYEQGYSGDEFNVYRALRHINPSPYMFYFDYGAFKLMGSSPEAQIQIRAGVATVNPIAGTYRRTGDKANDLKAAAELLNDPKELAEHAMLVDLARNDLNKHCDKVAVSEYKKIHEYSHVIHMVSKVNGELRDKKSSISVMADTFPAGTLSGAPKVRAMQLLADLEGKARGVYGGSVGYIDFNGDLNQAIIIRSFMAKGNRLHYQAGAGVVLHSEPEKELQEVHNKLSALRAALKLAKTL